MNITNIKDALTGDERAVSPVIGVILMVAITVILAAVIGAFVLQGNNLNAQAPQVSWDYSYNGTADGGNGEVTIVHQGGDNVDNGTLTYSNSGNAVDNVNAGSTELTAGTSVVLQANGGFVAGDTVRIVWTSPEGGSSSAIGTYKIP